MPGSPGDSFRVRPPPGGAQCGVPTPESGPCLASTEPLCEGRVTGSAAEQTPSLNSTLILTVSQLTPLQKINGRRISPRPQPPPSSMESPRDK